MTKFRIKLNINTKNKKKEKVHYYILKTVNNQPITNTIKKIKI